MKPKNLFLIVTMPKSINLFLNWHSQDQSEIKCVRTVMMKLNDLLTPYNRK